MKLHRISYTCILFASLAAIFGVTTAGTVSASAESTTGYSATSDVIKANNKGVKELSQKNYKGAIKYLRDAISMDPGYELGIANLAITYNNYGLEYRKNHEKALRMFCLALILDPTNDTTWQNFEGIEKLSGCDPLSYEEIKAAADRAYARADYSTALVEYSRAYGLKKSPELSQQLDRCYLEVYESEDLLLLQLKGKYELLDALAHSPGGSADRFDEKEYTHQVQELIRKHWQPFAYREPYGIVVTFTIGRQGDPKDIVVKSSCGIMEAEEAVLRAINNASPFPMLPPLVCDQKLSIPFSYTGVGYSGDSNNAIFGNPPPISKPGDLEAARAMARARERARFFTGAEEIYKKMLLVAQSEPVTPSISVERIETDLSRVQLLQKLTAQVLKMRSDKPSQEKLRDWVKQGQQLLDTVCNTADLEDSVKLVYAEYLRDQLKVPPFNRFDGVDALLAQSKATTEKYFNEIRAKTNAADIRTKAASFESKEYFEQALDLYRSEHDILEKALGSRDPQVIATGADLAGVYDKMKQFKKAQAEYEKALAAFRSIPNPGFEYGRMLEEYSNLLEKMHENKKAEEVAEESRKFFASH